MNQPVICSVCNCEIEEGEYMTKGFIGILPVTFCDTCSVGIVDMVLERYPHEEYCSNCNPDHG